MNIEHCLITGGTGFLGTHITLELLRQYPNIKIKTVSRNENEITRFMTLCANDKRVQPIIGDIRNPATVQYALEDVSVVIHLAAMKHIDLCEKNAAEAVSTNIYATQSLLNMFSGKAFVAMSTDKVVSAVGCYGASKLIVEKLVLEKAEKNQDCRYMIVRSGNIFGSTGSVIPKWKTQIKERNCITVTAYGITRFFIDPVILAKYIVNVIKDGETGKVYIPEQISITLEDLAQAVVDVYGNKETKIEVIGLRDAEKMHESLFSPLETNIVTQSKVETSDDKSNNSKLDAIYKVKHWLNKGE